MERTALLPLKSHYQQRKSAQGASDRAFPPNTESFPILQGLPALSRIPRTQGRRQTERTKGRSESHVSGTLELVTQKHSLKKIQSTVGCVNYLEKATGLFHLAPEEAEIRGRGCWGVKHY